MKCKVAVTVGLAYSNVAQLEQQEEEEKEVQEK
jgi:hypothetical protein